MADLEYKVPPIVLVYMPMKIDNSVVEAWNEKKTPPDCVYNLAVQASA